ncbi:hypothetical protein OHA40_09670 [Nocardia sp. NBC_00508]|uniref:hypothetical protein n=1 Tax=Nocardia sp. NBC_00508 TaxID=2975992 RepID=UPI002E80F5FC|nr:hypothetical protein [Nocardia sp. NBC_00508]WUD68348.1 hypothetical protein OHA40_09670 [Nocardia sp. NBC_00508]
MLAPPAELRFGAVRSAQVFLLGHIGATLLVVAGLWMGVEAGWVLASVRWAGRRRQPTGLSRWSAR